MTKWLTIQEDVVGLPGYPKVFSNRVPSLEKAQQKIIKCLQNANNINGITKTTPDGLSGEIYKIIEHKKVVFYRVWVE